MPPPNRLAPDPYNSLYYSVPTPAALEPQYVPPMPLRQQLENVSAGLGRGVTSQLQDVQALLSDPRAYATNTLRGLRELVRNPALVGNVLRDTARRATSGPLGLGEVAGEMLPLGVRSKTPTVKSAPSYATEISKEPLKIKSLVIPNTRIPNDWSLRQNFFDGTIEFNVAIMPSNVIDEPELSWAMQAWGNPPRNTGTATQMFLEALDIAKKHNVGYRSEMTLSDASVRLHERLKKHGVKFNYEDHAYVIPADELQKLNLAAVQKSLESTYKK